MTNKDLIKQYINIARKLTIEQYSKLNGSLKKSYIRHSLNNYDDNTESIPYYVFKDLSEEEKEYVVKIDLAKDEKGINNNYFKKYVDKNGDVLYDYIKTFITKIDGKEDYKTRLMEMVTYYSDVITYNSLIKIIFLFLDNSLTTYRVWTSIIDAVEEKNVLNKIIRKYVSNGGTFDYKSLAGILKYNDNPLEVYNLLGKQTIQDIIKNDTKTGYLRFEKLEHNAYNPKEVMLIKQKLNEK